MSSASGPLDDPAQVPRLEVVRRAELEPERTQKQHELVDLLGIRPRMDPIQRGDSGFAETFRSFDVRCDHALLYYPMGDEPLDWADVLHLAAIVELDPALGQVEVDGAATAAAPCERPIDFVQVLDLRLELGFSAAQLFAVE